VTSRVEQAIEKGLDFLARRQRGDGSWGKSSRGSVSSPVYPTAMTSLAGLCFLSSGSTPTRGPYARNIQRVRDYLLEYSTDSGTRGARSYRIPGLIYNPQAREQRPMYCHAFGMTFLAQIYPHETDEARRERVRTVLRNAVQLSEKAQTDDGGWGYQADYREDEGTLVVTQLIGLRACRDAGIYVPKRIIDGGVKYIEISTNTNGTVRYRPRDTRWRPGVTCAAVVALWQAGRYDDPLLKRISGYVNQYIAPRWSIYWQSYHHAEYVLYFLTLSQHVLGGDRWPDFYKRVSSMLLALQRSDGSWEGSDGGDVYGTAIALLVLQLPYERLTVYQR
jgi:hypothetical protein